MIIDLEKENMTINEALFIAKPNDTILLGNRIYNETLLIETPNLTFIGKDNTKISYSLHAGLKNQNGTNIGTTGSSIVRLLPSAKNNKFINIIFENSYLKLGGDRGEQAVAFKSEASFTYIKNCKFYSFQDTFYIDSGYMNLVIDSYIEGDVDFIFGSADCLFKNVIVAAKANNNLDSFYTAPSTIAVNRRGFIFKDSKFIQLNNTKTYVGRGWYPTTAKSPVIPRLKFIDCSFNGNIDLNLIKMNEDDLDIDILDYYNSKLNDELINNTNTDDSSEYINEVLEYYNEK